METQAIQMQPPDSYESYPPWVMLQRRASWSSDDDEDCPAPAADVKTLATARTTNNHLVGVSFHLATAPAASQVRVQIPDGVEDRCCSILAAHGDSVLIKISIKGPRVLGDEVTNYFIYNAGAAAAEPPRPPSLLLLPPYFLPEEETTGLMYRRSNGPVQGRLDRDATGILRRGHDELVVAELQTVAVGERTCNQKAPKLLILRSGSGEWVVKKPLIRYRNGEVRELLPPSWRPDTVFPVDDRILCWVHTYQGVIFCNMFDESPVLQYVPLPADPNFSPQLIYLNVCATAGGAVKFVNIFPRCCCGGAGATHCRRSTNAYTVKSWTLRMDDMSWLMDGIIDSTELWSLDAYKGLPHIMLAYPVVTLDEPHVICFMLCEDFHVNHGDETLWLIKVDIWSKMILSVCLHPGGRYKMIWENLIPCKVSDYFNSYPNYYPKGHTDYMPSVKVVDQGPDDIGCSVQSSCKTCAKPAVQVSAFLTAFQEIRTYGLAPDDMLKAYSILSDDNYCRRLKSLLELPMDLRKDWLLMEIKASEA